MCILILICIFVYYNLLSMEEIDVYQKVIVEKYGFIFNDEFSTYNNNINYMKYHHLILGEVRVYFHFETGRVINIHYISPEYCLDNKKTFDILMSDIQVELRNRVIDQIMNNNES